MNEDISDFLHQLISKWNSDLCFVSPVMDLFSVPSLLTHCMNNLLKQSDSYENKCSPMKQLTRLFSPVHISNEAERVYAISVCVHDMQDKG